MRQKYENLEGQLFHEQSEKQKLANVLKKHMNVPMMSSVDARKAGKGSKSNKGSGNPSRSGSRSHLQMIPEHDGGSSNSLGSGSGKGGGGREEDKGEKQKKEELTWRSTAEKKEKK